MNARIPLLDLDWRAELAPAPSGVDPRARMRPNSRFAKYVSGCYTLPGNIDTDIFMIPVSGGGDSSFMAILMHDLFPEVEWKLFFTDTKAEPNSLMVSLESIEAYLGKPIHRVVPEKGLYETMIEDYHGFMPSASSRWCTRVLKLMPYENYIASIRQPGQTIYTMVGIRADEPDRSGLVSHEEHIVTELPFKALGIRREHVFAGLAETCGIPSFYAYRTRSGCSACPFQRTSEVLGLLAHEPDEFAKAASYEKLSEADLQRYPENARQIEEEVGWTANHLGLPVPEEIDVRTADTAVAPDLTGVRRDPGMPLFGEGPRALLWVGAEFFVDPGVGGEGVFWQDLVTFSTTRTGLLKAMQNHYGHRLGTPEVRHHLTVEEMKAMLKLAYYAIRVPEALMDIEKVAEGSYVWMGNRSSYSRLKHLYLWARRTLHAEFLKRQLAYYARYQDRPLSWGYEQYHETQKAVAALEGELGEVVGMARFQPSDTVVEEVDERKVACFMCSI